MAVRLPSRLGGFQAEFDRSCTLARSLGHLGKVLVLERRPLVRLGRVPMSELRMTLRPLDPLAAFGFFHWTPRI